uniref:Vomeronasal type-1 receptor n=1 Tax=Nannospalax galili TaxID=1026970 RepID=A0A4Y1N5U2_NANGA|nr:vomeronasal type 1 receptor 11 [Nannospalax galili]AWV49773.1 vomeronasal type 1 receptor 11 [Nannospalax galili]AWV49797.1 vomeronasal type 1 receptor 11 [Nannospalax galili]
MAAGDLVMGIIFLSQTALGILGNSTLFFSFILADFTGIKARPTDLIVKHLTWANFIVLLCKGIPQTMATFGQTHFLDNVACKFVFYFHRVARGISLGSTSLLSIFQYIMISPNNSKCGQLKVRIIKFIGPSLSLCWVLHLMVNGFIPVVMTDMWNTRNRTGFSDFIYCAVVKPNYLIYTLYAVLLASTDVMCLGLMLWASVSMVFVLIKHKQRVRHIHRSVSTKSSLESRATQTVLILVSSFMLFYTTSAILTMCLTFVSGTSKWLVSASVAMAACFPALCPFVFIRHYISVFRLCCTH